MNNGIIQNERMSLKSVMYTEFGKRPLQPEEFYHHAVVCLKMLNKPISVPLLWEWTGLVDKHMQSSHLTSFQEIKL